jgi:hypothetical protein
MPSIGFLFITIMLFVEGVYPQLRPISGIFFKAHQEKWRFREKFLFVLSGPTSGGLFREIDYGSSG